MEVGKCKYNYIKLLIYKDIYKVALNYWVCGQNTMV